MSAALLPDFPISAAGPLSAAFRAAGLHAFRTAATHVERLPYGRIGAPGDWPAVLREGRGTCSSKHAALVALAQEHGRTDIELVLGMYEMCEANTPGVGAVLAARGFAAVPEAHCYLRHAGVRIDLTGLSAGPVSPFAALLSEEAIEPAALAACKEPHHRAALDVWAAERGLDPDDLWAAREACIRVLAVRARVYTSNMNTHLLEQARRLSPEAQLELVEALWDSIVTRDAVPQPTEAQKAELDRRVADHEAHPADTVPWDDVKASAIARLGR